MLSAEAERKGSSRLTDLADLCSAAAALPPTAQLGFRHKLDLLIYRGLQDTGGQKMEGALGLGWARPVSLVESQRELPHPAMMSPVHQIPKGDTPKQSGAHSKQPPGEEEHRGQISPRALSCPSSWSSNQRPPPEYIPW